MTEWTGVLYVFYTNKKIDDVFPVLERKIGGVGYKYKINSFKNEKSIFACKNAIMLKIHEEKGYNLDLSGEGCFCIEAKKVDLNGMATLTELDGRTNFEPHSINLMLDDIYYYVLTLPDFIENSAFCAKIKQEFIDTVKEI